MLTGADYAADGLGTFQADFLFMEGGPFRYREGTTLNMPANNVVACDRARHVGDIVAVVVAEIREQARDAAELVEVDYEPLPAVTDTAAAAAPDAPLVWDNIPGNLCCDVEYGDEAVCDEVFEKADHIARIELINNRVIVNPLEPRIALAAYDSDGGNHTLYTNTQMPHGVKTMLAEDAFKISPEHVRVICPDVGGGFGARAASYAEIILVAWCAKRLGRPVKWICERSEGFVSDTQARDNVTHAELALDSGGRFLALRVFTISNMGAYPGGFGPLVAVVLGPRVLPAVYATPLVYARIKVVYSNSVGTFPYRGAGQPEAVYVMERLIDVAARETGIDAVELRRRNHIPAAAMPYENPVGLTYDSGEYDANLQTAMDLADWDGFEQRRAESLTRGVLRGRGLANYIQVAAGVPHEWGALQVDAAGFVDLYTGTFNHGQGHETSFAQVIVDQLGVPFERVRLIQGDTDRIKAGEGTHGSRSMMMAGPLIATNSETIIDQARRIAAHKLEAAEADLIYADGRFTVVGTDLSLDLFEIAAVAEQDETLPDELSGPLRAESDYTAPDATYPSGTHVCEVEVDAETGSVRLVRFAAVDDVGRAINPLILHGQSHGGIAQGVGQALVEDCRYDRATGQLLSGSFMDYCLPRADDLPSIDVALYEALSPTNSLGIKGAGESGTTGAPPAVINAIVDALSGYGIRHIEMPATSEGVWSAIRDLTPA